MKKLLLVSLLMILPFTVKANDKIEYCNSVAYMAEAIMEARQNNIDITQMVSIAQTDSDVAELAMALIQDAYDTPRYSVERNQKNAIRDFKNDTFMTCITSLR